MLGRSNTFLYNWIHYNDYDASGSTSGFSQSYMAEHTNEIQSNSIPDLTHSFLERYSSYIIDWNSFIILNRLPESFIESKWYEWTTKEWHSIIRSQVLSPEFNGRLLKTGYSYHVCQYQRLTLSQIKEWIVIYPKHIMMYQLLTEDTILEYKSMFSFYDLCIFQKVPELLIMSQLNNSSTDFPWDKILIHQELDESFIVRTMTYWSVQQYNWLHLSQHQEEGLSQTFLVKYSSKIVWNYITCQQLDEETIDRFGDLDMINWKLLSQKNSGRVFTHTFLEKWKNHIVWYLFIYNQYTMEQLEAYIDCFTAETWEHIQINQSIPELFLVKHSSKFNIGKIFLNPFIQFSYTFLDQHMRQLSLHNKKIVIPFELLYKHKDYLLKEPQRVAAFFRINCLVRRCQRSFINKLYHPDSSYIQRKMIKLQLRFKEEEM